MNFVTMSDIIKDIEVDSFTNIFGVGRKLPNSYNPKTRKINLLTIKVILGVQLINFTRLLLK